jgi:polysaccharide pyruvyl transferase CsaB
VPTPPERLAVAAWVGSTNLGDELVFAALTAKLARRGLTPVAVSVDPAGTRRDHGVEAVASGRPGAVARVVGTADGVVLGGGGLLQDETSPFNLPLHLSRPVLALRRRTPFAGIGLGAGRLTTRAGRAQVRAVLARAVAVSCRDEHSADLLAGLGLRRPLVAADLALALPRPRVEVQDRIVASLRPWSGRRSLLPVSVRHRTAAPSAPEWFLTGMAAALDEAARRTGLEVHLVAFQCDRDDEVHRLVADRMSTPVTTAVPDVHTVVEEVARGRVVVGMRYHAGVAATLAGRPSVLVGYSTKVLALAHDLGRGATARTWDPGSLVEVGADVEEVLGRDDDVEEALARLRTREAANDGALDRLLEAGR